MRILTSILLLVVVSQTLWAQSTSRSGFPAEPESKERYRRFPCGGNVLLDEDFSEGLPDGWQVIDVDQLEPRDGIKFLTPNPGWQSVTDFKDVISTNKVFASPSFYEDTVGTSDDYLILPKTLLPDNTCLSWYAYSQDVEFGESYEIRVSTTTPDPAGFLANPAVLTISDQGSDFTYETASLADYGGQEVYIAFRHTSTDKFILVIDDVRMAEVENRDIAMFVVDPIQAFPGDSIYISGSVINKGLVPVVFDSMQMQIAVNVSNANLFSFSIADSFELLPNDTIQFRAPEAWVPEVAASVPLKVWVSGFGGDDLASNDTLARFQPIGNTVSVDPKLGAARLLLYPNPTSAALILELEQFQNLDLDVRIFNVQGQELSQASYAPLASLQKLKISTQNLQEGIYFLQVMDGEGKKYLGKFVKR